MVGTGVPDYLDELFKFKLLLSIRELAQQGLASLLSCLRLRPLCGLVLALLLTWLLAHLETACLSRYLLLHQVAACTCYECCVTYLLQKSHSDSALWSSFVAEALGP
jgi:hypothetical protein